MERSLKSSFRCRESRRTPSSLLLLDDDDDFRRALASNLRDDGFRVLEFRSPTQVPDIDQLDPVVAVIVDDHMPGEDGLTFSDRFHALRPDVPVVMLSAYMTGYLEAQLAQREFAETLHKPFDYEDLLDLLQRSRCAAP